MSTDTDFIYILEEEGLGSIGIDMFSGLDLPDQPSSCVFATLAGSYQQQSPNLKYSYPIVQLTVRNAKGNKPECDDRTNLIVSLLHGMVGRVVNGSRYVQIFQNSGPVPLLEPGTMRYKNVVNFYAIKTIA